MEFHPLLVQSELLDYCVGEGIAVQAFASLGSGDSRRARDFFRLTRSAAGCSGTWGSACSRVAALGHTERVPCDSQIIAATAHETKCRAFQHHPQWTGDASHRCLPHQRASHLGGRGPRHDWVMAVTSAVTEFQLTNLGLVTCLVLRLKIWI